MLRDCSELVRRSGGNAGVALSHRRSTTLPQQRILVGLLMKITRAIQLKINVLMGFVVRACDDSSVWCWGSPLALSAFGVSALASARTTLANDRTCLWKIASSSTQTFRHPTATQSATMPVRCRRATTAKPTFDVF
jgi:hypothetical protein